MLFLALFTLLAAGLANAQLPDVPKCSLNCFVNALTSDGCSSLTDFACHCQKPALISSVTPCVQKSCEVPDQIAVSKAVVSQCSAVGYPISVPAIETTTSASGTMPTDTTSTSTSSTSETSTSPNASTSASTPSPTSSTSTSAAESTTSSSSATPTSSKPHGSSSAGTGSSLPHKTSTPLPSKSHASSTPSSTSTYNAAGSVKGNMAGVAFIVAAAAYIL